MVENIKLAYYLFQEALIEGRLFNLFHQQIFRDRTATPAVMDLTQIQFSGNGLDKDYQFIELKQDDLKTQKWSFAVPSRGIKAYRNLKRGLRGFAVAKGSVILGDVWCVMPNGVKNIAQHPDLEMLGITCKPDEAYGMDMLISSDHRGQNLATPLQRYMHSVLKSEGYAKMYGYYWNDNIPAMWMHRMLHFKELPKRKVSRFLFLKWSA